MFLHASGSLSLLISGSLLVARHASRKEDAGRLRSISHHAEEMHRIHVNAQWMTKSHRAEKAGEWGWRGWLWHSVSLQCLRSAYPDYPFATTIITQTQHHKVEAFVFLVLYGRDGSYVPFAKSGPPLPHLAPPVRHSNSMTFGLLVDQRSMFEGIVCGSLCSKNEHK